MILNGLRLCFIGILFVAAKEDRDGITEYRNKQKMSNMDLLIDNMMHQRWEPDDRVCLEKILNIMNNVKNSTLWATWIWDAMQSPVGLLYGSKYHFGNYDQCMDAPWLHTHPEYRTQYCLADIKLADEELEHTYIHPDSHVKNYISTTSKYRATFNKLSLGVCLPVECKTRAVSQFVKVLFENSHLGNAVPDVNITVNPCQVAGAPVEYTTTFYIILLFLILIVTTSILCTICNIGKQNAVGSKLIKAFCMITNHSYLSKSAEDDIKVMHGMRFLTMGIVIALHVIFLTNWIGTGNTLQFDKDIDKYKLTILFHGGLFVDTFLMMSGLLVMKGIMTSKKINPVILIAKRYLRLAWMMGFIIMISIYLGEYCGDGPIWPIILKQETSRCEMNWWSNILMRGNYIDADKMCYPILWSLPVDFHLYTVVIIVYWIYTKNRRAGVLAFSILFIASLIIPGYVTYKRRLPGCPPMDIKTIENYTSLLLTNPMYVATHLRAGPYLVGVIAGYFLAIYKPIHNRGVISQLRSTVGFVIAFTLAMSMLLIGGTFHDKTTQYEVWEAAIFASLNRTIWAVAMASIIMLCEYGTVPLVGSFLSWKPWIPLSKLSYGVYLVHSLVFSFSLMSIRSPLKHSHYINLINTMGLLVVSNILSYMLHLFVEAPMTKISNILFQNVYNMNIKIDEKNGIEKNDIQTNGNQKKIL